MKRFRFPKNTNLVHIPFLLHDFTPWQQQVNEKLLEMKKVHGTSKSAHYGYYIKNGFAEIVIEK